MEHTVIGQRGSDITILALCFYSCVALTVVSCTKLDYIACISAAGVDCVTAASWRREPRQLDHLLRLSSRSVSFTSRGNCDREDNRDVLIVGVVGWRGIDVTGSTS